MTKIHYSKGLAPEEYSEKLRKDLCIEPLKKIDLNAIAKALDINLTEREYEGFTGLLIITKDGVLIGIRKSIPEMGRKRFTISHELGHYIIPTHKGNTFKCTDDNLNFLNLTQNDHEIEANKFASELLLPSKNIEKIINGKEPAIELIEDIASNYDVTLTASILKFIKLCKYPCALIISKDKMIKWFYKNKYFSPFIPHPSPVVDGTYAYIYFSRRNNLPREFRYVSANLWVEGKVIKRDTEILELSIPQPRYNQVLTILWLEEYEKPDEDLDEDYEDEFNGYLKLKRRE